MKNKSRFFVLALVVSLGVTNIAVPSCETKAAKNMGQIQQEMGSEGIEPAVESIELPAEDGDYVIYMENDKTDQITFADEMYEINTDSPAVILETDLSGMQLDQLEELSGQDEEIYVEENIFLMGASSGIDLEDIQDADEAHADLAERLALKRQLVEAFLAEENEDDEAEWNVQMIHADDVDAEVTGPQVKVAVLDSGVEFISGISVEKSINFVKGEQDLPYYMNDMTGHGTAVADIIHQVCPQAQIYSVKVMDCENRGRLSDVVAGIYWCIEQDVDIINMSFGTCAESDILREAVKAAAEQGIMLVSSAGNGGDESAVEYPAAFEEVIAVGAVDTSAEKTEESATGEELELVAPGEQILTKSMLGLETVNSGTSMAAPHVTGAAALLMKQSEQKDAAFIRKVLDKSSNPLGDANAYGYGLLDVAYAQELLNGYEEITVEEHADKEETYDENGAEFDLGLSEDNIYSDMVRDNSADTDGITPGETMQDMLQDSELGMEPEVGQKIDTDEIGTVEQVSRPVETYEEVDYVEGRWAGKKHSELAGEAEGGCFEFTKEQIDIFKTGAVFPDLATDTDGGFKHGSIFPEWHSWYGWVSQNYIANFIFATRIAEAGGNTTKLTKVNGQKDAVYQRMKDCISKEQINGKKWAAILQKWDYNSQSKKKQKEWRQMFLYGMALHAATDAFAHASCYEDETTGVLKLCVDNEGEDKPGFIENRWKCAQNTAFCITVDCSVNIEGEITDFSSKGLGCWKGFYMANILKYAEAVNGGADKKLTAEFKAVNCDNPPQHLKIREIESER